MDSHFDRCKRSIGHRLLFERNEHVSIEARGRLLIKNTQTQERELCHRDQSNRGESMSTQVLSDTSSLPMTESSQNNTVSSLSSRIENEISKLKNFRDLYFESLSTTKRIEKLQQPHKESKQKLSVTRKRSFCRSKTLSSIYETSKVIPDRKISKTCHQLTTGTHNAVELLSKKIQLSKLLCYSQTFKNISSTSTIRKESSRSCNTQSIRPQKAHEDVSRESRSRTSRKACQIKGALPKSSQRSLETSSSIKSELVKINSGKSKKLNLETIERDISEIELPKNTKPETCEHVSSTEVHQKSSPLSIPVHLDQEEGNRMDGGCFYGYTNIPCSAYNYEYYCPSPTISTGCAAHGSCGCGCYKEPEHSYPMGQPLSRHTSCGRRGTDLNTEVFCRSQWPSQSLTSSKSKSVSPSQKKRTLSKNQDFKYPTSTSTSSRQPKNHESVDKVPLKRGTSKSATSSKVAKVKQEVKQEIVDKKLKTSHKKYAIDMEKQKVYSDYLNLYKQENSGFGGMLTGANEMNLSSTDTYKTADLKWDEKPSQCVLDIKPVCNEELCTKPCKALEDKRDMNKGPLQVTSCGCGPDEAHILINQSCQTLPNDTITTHNNKKHISIPENPQISGKINDLNSKFNQLAASIQSIADSKKDPTQEETLTIYKLERKEVCETKYPSKSHLQKATRRDYAEAGDSQSLVTKRVTKSKAVRELPKECIPISRSIRQNIDDSQSLFTKNVPKSKEVKELSKEIISASRSILQNIDHGNQSLEWSSFGKGAAPSPSISPKTKPTPYLESTNYIESGLNAAPQDNCASSKTTHKVILNESIATGYDDEKIAKCPGNAKHMSRSQMVCQPCQRNLLPTKSILNLSRPNSPELTDCEDSDDLISNWEMFEPRNTKSNRKQTVINSSVKQKHSRSVTFRDQIGSTELRVSVGNFEGIDWHKAEKIASQITVDKHCLLAADDLSEESVDYLDSNKSSSAAEFTCDESYSQDHFESCNEPTKNPRLQTCLEGPRFTACSCLYGEFLRLSKT